MRFTLPESSHRRQRSAGGTLASAVIHAAVIGGTLVATGMSAERPRYQKVKPENLVFVKSDEGVQTRRPREIVPPAPTPLIKPTTLVIPPATLTVVVDPAIVPTGLPPVGETLAVPFDSLARTVDGSGSGAASSSGSGDTGAGAPPIVDMGAYEFQVPPCYANCDGSISAPILNVNDFICFLNRFAAGDSYANCDASTIVPTLNVNDFVCFMNSYAAGCP